MALQKLSAVRKNGMRRACVLPLVHHDMSTLSPLRANLITIASQYYHHCGFCFHPTSFISSDCGMGYQYILGWNARRSTT